VFRHVVTRVLLTGLVAVALGGASAVAASAGDLQAHGSDERLWLARVEPVTSGGTSTEQTSLFVRERGTADWRRMEPISARVTGLANRGSQLAILLPNGDWRLTTDGGFAVGAALPDAAKVIALGGDGASLWAVGLAPARPATLPTAVEATGPASQPASTAPSAPTTSSAPSAAPAEPARVLLYRLAPQGWEVLGALPDDVVPGDALSVSVGSAGGAPVVVHKLDVRTLRVYVRTADGGWDRRAVVESPGNIEEYKVLSGTPLPAVWYRTAEKTGRLWMGPASAGAQPINRELKVPGQAAQAIAYANGAIRLLWVDGTKSYEQRLHPDTGETDGQPTPALLPAISPVPAVMRWVQLTLTAALVFSLAATMRRRREMLDVEIDPAKFPLAPFATRFSAGVIDALPLLAAGYLAYSSKEPMRGLITLGIGLGVYIVLTMVVELVAGRSIGKLFTGLHVVGLDGRQALAGALVVRNLLRIVDVFVFMMPLTMIFFSPLRQRAGDLAAGTIVVQGKVGDLSRRSKPAGGEDDEADAKPEKGRKGDDDAA
jgi:uncharacterized RDD family membrane protein YckC